MGATAKVPTEDFVSLNGRGFAAFVGTWAAPAPRPRGQITPTSCTLNHTAIAAAVSHIAFGDSSRNRACSAIAEGCGEAGTAEDGGVVSSVMFVYVAGGSPDVADVRGRYLASRS